MIQYRVKGNSEQPTIMEIVGEKQGGYQVLITRDFDNFQEQTREFLSSELLETCLRTGYLTEMPADSSLMTA